MADFRISPDGTFVSADLLDSTGLVRHGVTTRHGAADVSFHTCADRDVVRAGRAAACAALGLRASDLVVGQQVHGTRIAVVDDPDRGRGAQSSSTAIPETDGLVTRAPGVPLCITVADCLPVFLLDPRTRTVALVHSGWRGTAGGIVPKALAAMADVAGTDPRDVLAALGPAIGGACYQVGDEVREALLQAHAPPDAFAPSVAGTWMVGLAAVVLGQLAGAGVGADRVAVAPWCTHCHPELFHSHRRDGQASGRLGAIIALNE